MLRNNNVSNNVCINVIVNFIMKKYEIINY